MSTRRAVGTTLWLQLLLVGALASVALLVLLVLRQGRVTEEVSERLMREYGAVAAWSYREHLVAEMRAAADELLGGVNHGEGLHEAPGVPDVHWIGHAMRWDPACQCHVPRRGPVPTRAYAFVLGSDTLGVAVNHSPRPGWLGDPVPEVPARARPLPPTPGERAATNRLLTAATRTHPRTTWGYLATLAGSGGETSLVVSRAMATAWGDTVVYALEYGPRAVEDLLGGVLASGALLPPALLRGRSNDEMLAIRVAHPEGPSLYANGPLLPVTDADVAQLDATFGGLTVTAQIRPTMREALFLAETPSSRVSYLLLLLLLAVAITAVAAVQLRREARFVAEREQFVANVSHELRTPLAQVRLVLDTLRLGRERDEEMRRAAVELADREVLRLQHLVDGLLRFTRRPSDDPMARVRLDVADEARRVVAEFEPLAAPQGVRVAVEASGPVLCEVEPGAVRQVLLNLLDNAVKYGRSGGVVRVDVTALPDGARIAVTDDGPGVGDVEATRIFEPYERGTEAVARAAGGSGIGLTIVRDIAHAHGGDARVERAPGGGARFVVDLWTGRR